MAVTFTSGANSTPPAGTVVDTDAGTVSANTQRVVIATDQAAFTNKVPANVAQINGVTPLMGNGVTGTGSQRVTIASDNTVFTVNAQPKAVTSGGATPYSLVSAATTNQTSVKGSAGQLYAIYVTNINAAVRYIKIYDSASAPTAGSGTPVLRIAIPGNTSGAGGSVSIPVGTAFTSGIGFTLVTGAADSDATAVAANDILVNLWYL